MKYIVIFRGNPIKFDHRTDARTICWTTSEASATRFESELAAGKQCLVHNLHPAQCQFKPVKA